MSDRRSIDAFEFARSGGKLGGRWPIARFARLRESLVETSGSVEYAVQGMHDEQGRPALRVTADGVLRLCCQRCLGSLEVPVHVDSLLRPVATQAEIDSATDELDRVLATRELDVGELIEDELLLAVPDSPRHGRCDVPVESRTGGARSARAAPFSGLRALLGGSGRRKGESARSRPRAGTRGGNASRQIDEPEEQ